MSSVPHSPSPNPSETRSRGRAPSKLVGPEDEGLSPGLRYGRWRDSVSLTESLTNSASHSKLARRPRPLLPHRECGRHGPRPEYPAFAPRAQTSLAAGAGQELVQPPLAGRLLPGSGALRGGGGKASQRAADGFRNGREGNGWGGRRRGLRTPPSRRRILHSPAGTTSAAPRNPRKIKCEEGDLNPHGCLAH